MLDVPWLSSWIDSRHLQEDCLRGYSDAFRAHPSRLLTMKQFLRDEVARQIQRFLAREARYRPVYGLMELEGAVAEEEWRQAAQTDRFFKFGELDGVREEFQLSSNLLTYLKVRMAMLVVQFRNFLRTITGLPLESSRHG